MDVVILAAGNGTRMRPLTDAVPKPLLSVGDRPLVAHVADAAVVAGATSLVIVVGPETDRIRSTLGDHYRGVPIRYATQETPDGTATAVRTALSLVDGPFAVLNGDNLYDAASVRTLVESGPSLGVHRVENPSSYGVVETADGRVVSIVEKPADPTSNLANAGAYVFPAPSDDWFGVRKSDRGEYELTDVVARVIEHVDVTPVEMDRWMDIGRPWELLEANESVIESYRGRVEGDVHETAVVSTDAVVEAGATIRPGTVIEGSVLVCSGATVGPNASVRGTTLVGEGVSIGHAAEVKNSVLLPGATIPHLSYVGDSVVGHDVNLGAGTMVANLRHDDEPVSLTVSGERRSTGRRKFGAVIGPGVKTGINTSILPGVTLAAGTTTFPGEVVSRDR